MRPRTSSTSSSAATRAAAASGNPAATASRSARCPMRPGRQVRGGRLSAAAAQASTASALRSRNVRRCSGLGVSGTGLGQPRRTARDPLRQGAQVAIQRHQRGRAPLPLGEQVFAAADQVGQSLLEVRSARRPAAGRRPARPGARPWPRSRGRRVQPAGRGPGRRQRGQGGGATLLGLLPRCPAPAARRRRRPSCRPARPAPRPPTPGAGARVDPHTGQSWPSSSRAPSSPAIPAIRSSASCWRRSTAR